MDFHLIIGLILLGTYIVATLDDIVRMKASRSFLYVWIIIAIIGLVRVGNQEDLIIRIAAMIIAFIVLHYHFFKFRLAKGDIFAMYPVLAAFPYHQVLLFIVLTFVIDKLILKTYYIKLRKRSAYPFMPALCLALVLTLIFSGVIDTGLLSLLL